METHSSSMEFLIDENIAVIERGREVLSLMDDESFARPVEGSGASSSLGKHFRHVINFYENLVMCDEEVIDYDQRIRDRRIEEQVRAADAKLADLAATLNTWKTEPEQRPRIGGIFVHGESGLKVNSDLGRELKFVLEHSIHHFALVGLLMRQMGYDIPREFGVAPSTIAYEKRSDG
jgi:uncharacterized damage-inducible protein DinB